EDLRPLQAGLPDALADLTLVEVGGGSIDQPVTDPQGFADRCSGLLRWGLEDAETQCRHLHAVVQCDVCTHTGNARFSVVAEEGTVSTPFGRQSSRSTNPDRSPAGAFVAARLPSSFSRSSDELPGSAVKANMNQSRFAGNSIAW